MQNAWADIMIVFPFESLSWSAVGREDSFAVCPGCWVDLKKWKGKRLQTSAILCVCGLQQTDTVCVWVLIGHTLHCVNNCLCTWTYNLQACFWVWSNLIKACWVKMSFYTLTLKV